jgi:hypothetical protein
MEVTERARQGLLAGLIVLGCSLSVRAEIFVAAAGLLTLGLAAASSREALSRAWVSIDRPVLAGTVLMSGLWAYGFILGLVEGHPIGHVVRNFFGLAFFLPALLAASLVIGESGISRLAVRSGQLALALLVVLRVGSVFDLVPLELFQFLGVPVGLSDFGLRIYSFGAFPIFGWQAVVALRLYQAIDANDAWLAVRQAAQLTLIVAGTWFVTESKGILLGSIAVLGVPLLLQLRWATHVRYAVAVTVITALQLQVIKPGTTYVAINWLGLQPSAIMAAVVEKARLAAAEGRDPLAADSAVNPIDTIFAAESLGNMERYAQARELLRDVVPFGHGLGAPITTGFSRSVIYPYGFELSFLNVIHKLGVFSLLYFAFLVYCGFRIVTSSTPIVERAAALGLLGYTFPSIGNPVLFAVQAVFLHMIAVHGTTRSHGSRCAIGRGTSVAGGL